MYACKQTTPRVAHPPGTFKGLTFRSVNCSAGAAHRIKRGAETEVRSWTRSHTTSGLSYPPVVSLPNDKTTDVCGNPLGLRASIGTHYPGTLETIAIWHLRLTRAYYPLIINTRRICRTFLLSLAWDLILYSLQSRHSAFPRFRFYNQKDWFFYKDDFL